jgi:hypothetical protein
MTTLETTIAATSNDYPYLIKEHPINIQDIRDLIIGFRPVMWNAKDVSNKMTVKNRSMIRQYNGGQLVIYDNWKKTEAINNITDLFSEHVRANCNFNGHVSPLEYWKKHKTNILKTVRPLTIHNLREYMFFHTKLCNNFRITVALAVLNIFKPQKWLDISAGWGDRLLAAIFYGVDLYVSTDPNLDMHPCYQDIITTFVSPDKRSDFIIYPTGFEVADLPETLFDIVFSSPPFFDLEQYSNHPDDSLKYKNEEEWCVNFLWPSLVKAYSYLKRNGHMVLYMSGSARVMSYLKKLDMIMKYKGVIYFFDTKPRAMFVWQKVKSYS